jgi:hypothetical protein
MPYLIECYVSSLADTAALNRNKQMSKQFTIAYILQTAALELSQTSIDNSKTQDRIWQ